MPEEVAALQIRLEASIARFEQQMRRAEGSMRRSSQQIERQAQSLDERLAEVGSQFGVEIPTRATAAAAAVVAIGAAMREVVRNGDQIRQLEARFEALTGSAERAAEFLRGTLDISGETGAAINSVGQLVTRFQLAGQEIGATDAETLRFTETLVKLGQIGGASADEIANGTTQLAQGLAAGIIRAEEFNSIMENTPFIARAAADALGLSFGELRQEMLNGELTARRFFDAILSKARETDQRFSDMPATLDRATGRMVSAWGRLTAEIDKSIGASSTLAGWFDTLASKVEALASARAALREGGEAAAAVRASQMEDRRAELEARIAAEEERLSRVPEAVRGAAGGVELERLRAELRTITDAARFTEAGRRQIAALNAPPAAPTATEGTPLTPETAQMPPSPRAPRDAPAAPSRTDLGGIDLGVPSPSRGGGGGGASGPSQAEIVEQETIRIVDSYADRIEAMMGERQAIGMNAQERALHDAAMEASRVEAELLAIAQREEAAGNMAAAQAARDAIPAITALAETHANVASAIEKERAALELKAEADRQAQQAAEQSARSTQQAMDATGQAISQAIVHAQSLEDAFKKVAVQMLGLAVQGLFGVGPMGGALGGMFGGGISGAAFAKGGAFQGGRVIPFATGGVVSSPTTFPMAGGNIGLMGEAGPEAILPLKRGRGGALGVVAEGGGARGEVVVTLGEGLRGEIVGEAVGVSVRQTNAMMSGPGFDARVANSVRSGKTERRIR